MADKVIEVQGVDECIKNIDKVLDGLKIQVRNGIEKAAKNTAEDIQIVYKGGNSPGFKDRTGALRASITGGLIDNQPDDSVVGFVGAGDDSPGSEGKRTKDYVSYIEFGEFSRAGHTSFLRSGVQKSQRQIAEIIRSEINLEGIL